MVFEVSLWGFFSNKMIMGFLKCAIEDESTIPEYPVSRVF